jgi:hypothetical protein
MHAHQLSQQAPSLDTPLPALLDTPGELRRWTVLLLARV